MEENNITGSLEHICDEIDHPDQIFLVADCGTTTTITAPEIECQCCDDCCVDGVECHGQNYISQIDPIYETEFERTTYAFSHTNLG